MTTRTRIREEAKGYRNTALAIVIGLAAGCLTNGAVEIWNGGHAQAYGFMGTMLVIAALMLRLGEPDRKRERIEK